MVLLWSADPRYRDAASAAEYADDKDDEEFPKPTGFLCCRQKFSMTFKDERLKDFFSDDEIKLLVNLGFRRKIGKTFKNCKGMAMCNVLHGAHAQDPDHKQWMTKLLFKIYESRYIAISYTSICIGLKSVETAMNTGFQKCLWRRQRKSLTP